jgi:arylsulfatase A-like enzyme
MCSPTRASLLTGRHHHRIGQGRIAEFPNDWDGYAGEIPKSSSLAAEGLNDYGYVTDTAAADASKQRENGHTENGQTEAPRSGSSTCAGG